jgi:hypothetical protein
MDFLFTKGILPEGRGKGRKLKQEVTEKTEAARKCDGQTQTEDNRDTEGRQEKLDQPFALASLSQCGRIFSRSGRGRNCIGAGEGFLSGGSGRFR